LKLSNARGAEQQGKDFVKDLGINRKEMRSSLSATRSIYGVVMLAALRVWHHDCSDNFMEQQQLRIRNGMVTFLEASTVLFQISFAASTFFLWDGGQLLALIDTVFCVVAPFADFFWFKEYETSSVLTEANVARCILIGYDRSLLEHDSQAPP
jgi:hypothetical protein